MLLASVLLALQEERAVPTLELPPPAMEDAPLELTRWLVLADPVTVSDEDIAQFAERIHFNARSVQRRVGN